MAIDPALAYLTDEQLVGAAAVDPAVFLEAAPGSGKTTVAAQRFGALRYRRRYRDDGSPDSRAVLAVSFTRSATRELRHRVRRAWGPTAITWPHRICTFDSLMADLLHDLLQHGLVTWPGGLTHLDVHDSWKALVPYGFASLEFGARLGDDRLVEAGIVDRHDSRRTVPEPAALRAEVESGRCTHSDVRRVLHRALATLPSVGEHVMARLATTVSALIVDEIYDANTLDLAMVKAIRMAGATVTVVGDPWQALYGWRGATPDKVPALIADLGMTTLPLSRSFRWDTKEQQELADSLRQGRGVVLSAGTASGLDVVLAHQWESLWSAGDDVLPLAFKSTPGTTIEAATTLLLHVAAQSLLQAPAAFVGEAFVTLGITDTSALQRMTPPLSDVLRQLAQAKSREHLKDVRTALIEVVGSESARVFPGVAAVQLKRLDALGRRLTGHAQLVPGLTVHQAKGQEWNRVGVRLTDDERRTLAEGLDRLVEDHRRLYVACTRARLITVDVTTI